MLEIRFFEEKTVEFAQEMLEIVRPENALVINTLSGEFSAVAEKMEIPCLEIQEEKAIYNEAIKKIDSFKAQLNQEETVVPGLTEFMREIWINNIGIEQDEYDHRQPQPFYARQGKALKELMKLYSKEEIIETLEKGLRDDFWNIKLKANGIETLYMNWRKIEFCGENSRGPRREATREELLNDPYITMR